ncbi:MAG: dihydroorotate dehydrogenase [Gemmataceae bacterium]|nr:dihydroorotate dehydrogenase [Gemmataceae bacterium]
MYQLDVKLGRLYLKNPILAASGTFGYAREMEGIVDFAKLGGIIPKTVTKRARIGNPPPRTVETPSGMLNAIGLDNDGIDHFIAHHLPYLGTLPTAIIANIAGKTEDEFLEMAEQIGKASLQTPLAPEGEGAGGFNSPRPLGEGSGVRGFAGLELNLSCPNVSGGVDFATDPHVTARVVAGARRVCPLPIIAKLTPNVTNIVPIAQAAADAGADAVSLVNTFIGMAIDWKKRRPILGNVTGGLSGPAIKPLALRLVYQVARAVKIPIIGVGGISTIDDVMEFLLAGASAVQIGTANFFDPTVCGRLADELPKALEQLGATKVQEVTRKLN